MQSALGCVFPEHDASRERHELDIKIKALAVLMRPGGSDFRPRGFILAVLGVLLNGESLVGRQFLAIGLGFYLLVLGGRGGLNVAGKKRLC